MSPLLRDLIKDSLWLIEEEKKLWRQVDSNSGPLGYESVALTTMPPPLSLKRDRKPNLFSSNRYRYGIGISIGVVIGIGVSIGIGISIGVGIGTSALRTWHVSAVSET